MKVKVMMYNIRSSAIRWQMHDLLSDGNSNVCSLSLSLSLSPSLSPSLTVCEIFAKSNKMLKL